MDHGSDRPVKRTVCQRWRAGSIALARGIELHDAVRCARWTEYLFKGMRMHQTNVDAQLVDEWKLSSAATLGSSVRTRGSLLEVSARLPSTAKRFRHIEARTLALRIPDDATDEFCMASAIVGKSAGGYRKPACNSPRNRGHPGNHRHRTASMAKRRPPAERRNAYRRTSGDTPGR